MTTFLATAPSGYSTWGTENWYSQLNDLKLEDCPQCHVNPSTLYSSMCNVMDIFMFCIKTMSSFSWVVCDNCIVQHIPCNWSNSPILLLASKMNKQGSHCQEKVRKKIFKSQEKVRKFWIFDKSQEKVRKN